MLPNENERQLEEIYPRWLAANTSGTALSHEDLQPILYEWYALTDENPVDYHRRKLQDAMNQQAKAFKDMVVHCAGIPELVTEFNRLSGCHLGQSLSRSPIDALIDNATGYQGETDTDMGKFCAFVRDCIYLPLLVSRTEQD